MQCIENVKKRWIKAKSLFFICYIPRSTLVIFFFWVEKLHIPNNIIYSDLFGLLCISLLIRFNAKERESMNKFISLLRFSLCYTMAVIFPCVFQYYIAVCLNLLFGHLKQRKKNATYRYDVT